MNYPELLEAVPELHIRKLLTSRTKWQLVCDDAFHELFTSWEIPARQLIKASTLEDALRSDKFEGELGVICVAGDEALYKRIMRDYKRPCLGLFTELVLRAAALAPPRFFADDYPPPAKSYAIACLPRAGSTVLAKELGAIGAGSPTETFRDYVTVLLKHRKMSRFSVQKWWTTLTLAQTKNEIFATKVIWDMYKMATEHMTHEEAAWLEEKFNDMTIIYLERSDKVAQAVSDFIARQTGVWHLWPKQQSDYNEKLARVDENIDAIFTTYQRFVNGEEKLKAWVARHEKRVIKIKYDDLAQNTKQVIRGIAKKIKFPVPDTYDARPLSLAPTQSPLHAELAEKLRKHLAERGAA